MKQWRPIGKYSRQDTLNMGVGKPPLVINTEIEGRLIVLSDGERTISTLLPVEHVVCALVDVPDAAISMTPERVTMLRSLLALAEVEEPSYGRGEIHAEILAAIEEAKALLTELEVTE